MEPLRTIEEYIEIIHKLQQDSPVARVKDIAAARKVKLPTVTSAIDKLKIMGLVEHDHYGFVALTDTGKKLAEELEITHATMKKLFTEVLGIDEDIAEKDACKMEHYISPETKEALVNFLQFLEKCPKGSEKMLKLYKNCYLYSHEQEMCQECKLNSLN